MEFKRETNREKSPNMIGSQGLKDGELIRASRDACEA
jgi:hypothetical protein